MIEPSLRNVEQALDNGPQEAKHTHRNDPWKVKQILLSGSDRRQNLRIKYNERKIHYRVHRLRLV